VRKINVDTDNRLAITGAIRKVFWETPEKFGPSRLSKAGSFGDEAGRRRPHEAIRARPVRQPASVPKLGS